MQASQCQQAFSKPCLINLISKDAKLIPFIIFLYSIYQFTHCFALQISAYDVFFVSIQCHWPCHSKSATSLWPDKGTSHDKDNVYQETYIWEVTDNMVFISYISYESWIVCNFWSFNFWNNVSIFQEHSKKLNFRYTFYQFRKSLQSISIKTTAFMLKLDCLLLLEGRK